MEFSAIKVLLHEKYHPTSRYPINFRKINPWIEQNLSIFKIRAIFLRTNKQNKLFFYLKGFFFRYCKSISREKKKSY